MKQYAVISAPVDTYSGYGARARDFIKAVYELKKEEWDIVVLPQRWGGTPWGYLEDHNEEWGWMIPLLNKTNQLRQQPDFWCQVTIPNEFQAIGKFNLGLTAGIETTVCHPTWIEGLNRMDMNLVSSEHGKKVFVESSFQEQNQQGQTVKEIKLQKPVEVLFEGADLNTYFFIDDEKDPSDMEQTDLVESLDSIKEDFCFLFVGHWIQGDLGQDRKNVGLTIKTFLETFKNKKNKPALILKTSGGSASIIDRNDILAKIESVKELVNSKDLPNIYLIHGDFHDKDINNLYNHHKVKAMISLTKGEGFGRPLLEFSLCKKPIIASHWSGHLDFLSEDFVAMIDGVVKPIHASSLVEGILIQESSWFEANLKQTQIVLEDVFTNYKKYKEKAKQQAQLSKTKFSFDQMKTLMQKYLDLAPKQIQLKLPTLKKIELPKLKKVE
ncbi:MAG: glycosyltransferase [bacterium]